MKRIHIINWLISYKNNNIIYICLYIIKIIIYAYFLIFYKNNNTF